MRTYELPHTDLTASSVVAGLMRIARMDDGAIRDLIDAALDCGVTMVDHADVYGGDHGCERRYGEAVSDGQRRRLLVQTKVGLRGGWFDFSYAHIMDRVHGSLRALRSDHIDMLLLHRPDTLVEPEEVARAFDELHGAGTVRHFGVSNFTPGQIEVLRTAVRQPLAVNQVQLSIAHASLITQGIAANMAELDQSVSRDIGLLDWSRRERMTLQAWSPYQAGFFGGPFIGDRARYAELNDALDAVAEVHGVTPTAVATAWIVRHPARMQVVTGTTRPERLREAAAGSDVELSREEWYRLLRAAGHTVP